MTEPKNKDWQLLEHLVKLLETSIDPDCTIEHDVRMPVLTSTKGRTRQCDVLIRKGNPPRETITLVEVQDRNKKVDINTFNGWMVKLSEVGAQHLICVSRHDFPESIKEKVAQSGQTVRLMTLKSLDVEDCPFSLSMFKFTARKPIVSDAREIKIKKVMNNTESKLQKFNPTEKRFRIGKNVPISFNELIISYFNSFDFPEGDHQISLPIQKSPKLHFLYNDNWDEIIFSCTATLNYQEYNIPVTALNYQQFNGGDLAWVVEGTTYDNELKISLPLVRLQSGEYEIRSMMYEGDLRDFNLTKTKSD